MYLVCLSAPSVVVVGCDVRVLEVVCVMYEV